jgi:transcriptional regulator with XRE-family HTH domain
MSGGALAQALGVAERTQRKYEADESVPDARYLAAALTLGIDVEFILGRVHRSLIIMSESSEASAVVRAVEAVEEACSAASTNLSTYKKSRLIALVHRQLRAGQDVPTSRLAELIDLATEDPPRAQ